MLSIGPLYLLCLKRPSLLFLFLFPVLLRVPLAIFFPLYPCSRLKSDQQLSTHCLQCYSWGFLFCFFFQLVWDSLLLEGALQLLNYSQNFQCTLLWRAGRSVKAATSYGHEYLCSVRKGSCPTFLNGSTFALVWGCTNFSLGILTVYAVSRLFT